MWENNLRVLIWQFYCAVTLCRRAASVLRTVWVQSDRFQFFFKREVSLGVNSHIWRGVSCFFFAFGRSSRLTLLVGEQHTCSISQTFLVSYEKWPPKSENPKNTVFRQHDGTTPYVSTPDLSTPPIQLQDFSTPRPYNSKTLQLLDFTTPRLYNPIHFNSKTLQPQDFTTPRLFNSKTLQPQMLQPHL